MKPVLIVVLSSFVGIALAVKDAKEAMLTTGKLVIQSIDWPVINLEKEDILQSAPPTVESWKRPLGRGKFLKTGVVVNEEFDYKSELLMLARAIYSETKNPAEMYYIGWIIRNRVETGYRGEKSYRAVTLDPVQFSAFNDPKMRSEFLSLGFDTENNVWKRALDVARGVIRADKSENPFSEDVRHFYAPRSMEKGRVPTWARGGAPVRLLHIDQRRLLVFAGVE